MSKKNLKSKPKRRKTVFSLNAPQAKEVFLAGDFNEWMVEKHPLKKGGDGVWKKSTLLFPGSYEYKYFVDGEWALDPDNHQICANKFGTHNNVITVNE